MVDAKKTYQDAIRKEESAAKSWGTINELIGGPSKDNKYEEAAQLFTRAAQAFKSQSNYIEAANSYQKAAQCYQKTKYNDHELHKNTMEAANCLLKYDPAAGIKVLIEAKSHTLVDHKVFDITKQIAEECEKINDLAGAITHYTVAADIAQPSKKVDMLAHASDINIQLGDYTAAIGSLSKILAQNMIYYHANQLNYMLAIVILHMCVPDYVAARKAVDKYGQQLDRELKTATRIVGAALLNDHPEFALLAGGWYSRGSALLTKCMDIANEKLYERYKNNDFR